jgi:DNA-directed RNA polymerase subunit RPC12/RpoP
MKSTQRIKGNLYFVILPMFSLLAKKHRRATNYIWEFKSKGFMNCYKIKKLPANVDGDDIYKKYIGSVILGLPDCKIQYELMDIENKKKIEIEEGLKYDFEKHEGNKKFNKFKEWKKTKDFKEIKSIYIYKCHACGHEFESKHELNRVIKCINCGQRVFIDIQNLIASPKSKISNGDKH